MPKSTDSTPLELLDGVQDWQGFLAALGQCDRWWRLRYDWGVLGEHSSWQATIQELHKCISDDWDELDEWGRRCLLGATHEENYAMVGRMRQWQVNGVFGDSRKAIQNTIHRVIAAPGDAFPQLAFETYETLYGIFRHIDGVSVGTATRLLTLARPDRFVSVNGASERGLAATYGLARTTLGKPRNYRYLLNEIYSQHWYGAPQPLNSRERTIWGMRCALLDSFVYAKPGSG